MPASTLWVSKLRKAKKSCMQSSGALKAQDTAPTHTHTLHLCEILKHLLFFCLFVKKETEVEKIGALRRQMYRRTVQITLCGEHTCLGGVNQLCRLSSLQATQLCFCKWFT